MSLTEESMRFLEEQIPELAEAAVRQAYWDASNSGNSVLEYEDKRTGRSFSGRNSKNYQALACAN